MKCLKIFSLLLVLILAGATPLFSQTCVITGAGACFGLGGSVSGGAILSYRFSCNDVSGGGTEYLKDAISIACATGLSVGSGTVQQSTSSGTLRNLYCLSSDPPPSGESFVFTVMKSGAPTAITCTMGAGTVSCSDTANAEAVLAGDRIAVRMVESGAGTDSGIIQCHLEVAL